MYPEELRISNSRSLWRPEPVPRWTGEPHQLSALLRACRETPGTFWLRCPPFQGQTDKKEGNLERVGRKGRRQNLVLRSPCPAPVPPSSECLLLGKLSGPGEGLGSFPNGPERSAGSIPVTASASQYLLVAPESPERKENPCGTKGTLRASTWSQPLAPSLGPGVGCGDRSATLTQTGPGFSFRWPRTLGRGAACRAAGALPLWRVAG